MAYKNSNTSKILQWNANGIINKHEMFTKLLFDISPQIICLQETYFKADYYKKLKNFKCFFKNRINTTKASGGVATYIDESLISQEIHLDTNLEAVAVSVTINNKKFNICNLYLPNSQELLVLI